MKVTKLRIQNFRNHADSTLDLANASFVVVKGGNFQGKSSIAQAVSMLLTPSTDGLDAQGHGYAAKIRSGEKKAVITGDIQGKSHLIRREVVLNTNTTGRTQRSECVDDPEWHPTPFDKFLEVNKAALFVCLNTSAFLQMDEKSQKSLLARLALPERYEFPPVKVEAVEKVLGSNEIDFTGEPFTVIDKAYKKLYDERAIVNRQVKEFVVPDRLPASTVDSTSLQAQLEEARAKRQTIFTERDAALHAAHADEVKRTKLSTEITAMLEKLEEGKTKLKAAEANILTLEKLREMKQIAETKPDYDLLTRYVNERTAKVELRKQELEHAKALPANQAICSACGQTVSAEYAASMVTAAEEALKVAQASLADTIEARQKLGDPGVAVATIEKHASALAERVQIEKSLDDLVTKGKSKRVELGALGEKTDTAAAFVQPLEEVEKRITTLTEQLRPAIAAEEREKEIAARSEQLARLQTKAAALNDLVAYFDKDGVKADLLAEHIGGFENLIVDVLEAWGYDCFLSIEPYQFECKDARGVTTPVRELSGSEQLMFSLALQCAVSRAAGVGLVVADRMDTFLPSQRQKANKILYSMVQNESLEQVIAIMSDENADAPNLPNSAFFLVKEGAVQRLGTK